MDKYRRNNLEQNTPAEKAIFDAMQEVEKMPADVKLTKAVILLGKAKDMVGDYVDGSTEENQSHWEWPVIEKTESTDAKK